MHIRTRQVLNGAGWPRRREKDRLEVVEEPPAQRRGGPALMVDRHQALILGPPQSFFDCTRREAGSFAEPACRHTIGESHRVQHEFERQVGTGDFGGFRDELAAHRVFEIARRLPEPRLADDPVRERNLRMCTRADAQVVTELPVVPVVPALATGARVGRDFVMKVAGPGRAGFDPLLHRCGRILVR